MGQKREELVDGREGLHCPSCKRWLRIDEILKALTSYWKQLNVVTMRCPYCESSLDFQAANSELALGYVYAAGSAHFSAVTILDVPGMDVSREDMEILINYAGQSFRIGPPRPSGGHE